MHFKCLQWGFQFFFVHSLKFSSRVTKCFVSPAELMCSSTDPHPPTLKFRNKNGSNKTRLFLVYLSLKSRKFNDALWIWDFGVFFLTNLDAYGVSREYEFHVFT